MNNNTKIEIIRFSTVKEREYWNRDMFRTYRTLLKSNFISNQINISTYDNYVKLEKMIKHDLKMKNFVDSIKPEFNPMEIRILKAINITITKEIEQLDKEFEERMKKYETRQSQTL